MKISKSFIKLLFIFTFILSFFLTSNFILNTVQADYLVSEGMEWTYEIYNGTSTVYLGIEVTDVNHPDGPILGNVYPLDQPPMIGFELNGSFICDEDTLSDYESTGYKEYLYYGGIERECIVVEPSPDVQMIFDLTTGILLQMDSLTSDVNFMLISWSLEIIPTAEWYIEVGDEWTYDYQVNESSEGYMGIVVKSVPIYPDSPIGTIYEDGELPLPNQELSSYVYDNVTIDEYISLYGNDTGDYGGRTCEYVIVDDGYGLIQKIDIETGIILELNTTIGDDSIHLELVSWLNIADYIKVEWLVEEGDGWSYAVFMNSEYYSDIDLLVTSVPPYPDDVKATAYALGGPPYPNMTISNEFVFDNVTIDGYISLNGTNTGDYGGRTCEYVTFEDIYGTSYKVDIDTGIALEKNITEYSVNQTFILIDWTVEIPGEGKWLVEVGDQFTHEIIEDGNYTGCSGFEITSIPEYPNPLLGDRYYNYELEGHDYQLGTPYIVDNNTIAEFISIGSIEIREYGGQICNSVIIDNYYYAGLWVYDIDTAILLEVDLVEAGHTLNITLVSWSVLGPNLDIEITIPNEGALFNTIAPEYNITIIGDSPDYSWYILNGGEPIYIPCIEGINTGTINSTAWSALPDGEISIEFYFNNSISLQGFGEITITKDTQIPIISLVIPVDSQISGATPPSYEVSITEANINNTWYTLNDGEPIYFSGEDGTNIGNIDTDAWGDLMDGSVNITFYVEDIAGNLAYDYVMISKESIIPVVVIDEPINSQLCDDIPPTFNVSITEINIDYSWYTINGGEPIYIPCIEGINTGTIDASAWADASDGSITIIFYTNDTAGNIGYDEVVIIKDTHDPIVSIISPVDLAAFGNPPSYEVNITEANIDYSWYTINGGAPIYFIGANGINTGTIDDSAWADVSDGTVIIVFYTYDTAGNFDSDEVAIIKSTKTRGSGIPGYDLYIIFGIIGIFSLTVAKKFKYKIK